MTLLDELAERIARLEEWANEFSAQNERGPVFMNEEQRRSLDESFAALRARSTQEGDKG